MKKQIAINRQAVDNAVVWIKQNNKYMKEDSLADLTQTVQCLVDNVVKRAREDWQLHYAGTVGLTVFFMPEEDHYGTVEILVDPCVGSDYDYVDIEGEV
ncbi:MAG: hypothetical protein ACRC6V_01900 [Bacteroidales bacterium]